MLQYFHLQNLPRAFYVILCAILINSLGGFVIPFLALYLTGYRHFSLASTGLIAGSVGLGVFLSGPCGGFLADHFGRRRVLVISMQLAAALTLLFSQMTREPFLMSIGFCLGFFTNLYGPAASAAVADVVPEADLQRAFRLVYWVNNIGFAVAGSLAGFFANKNFQILFFGDALTTLLFAFIVWKYLPESRPEPKENQAKKNVNPFKNKIFVSLFVLMLVAQILVLQATVAFPVDMANHGISAIQYGLMASLNGILIVVLQPLLGTFLNFFSPFLALGIAALLTGIGFAINAFAGTLIFYVITVVFWSIGEVFAGGSNSSIVAKIAPSSHQGRYQGAMAMTYGSAAFLAPIIGSSIMQKFGAPTLWIGCVGLSGAVAVCYFILKNSLSESREPKT